MVTETITKMKEWWRGEPAKGGDTSQIFGLAAASGRPTWYPRRLLFLPLPLKRTMQAEKGRGETEDPGIGA
jgi:hypothetical protein